MLQPLETAPTCPRCRSALVAEASFCHRCGFDVRNPGALSTEALSERARACSLELMALLKETIRRSPPLVAPTVVFVLEALQRVLMTSIRTRPLGMALGLALRAARSLL